MNGWIRSLERLSHISSAKHLHQVLIGVEFCISVVSILVLVGANRRQ